MNIKKVVIIILISLSSDSLFSQEKPDTAASNVSIIAKEFKVPYINNTSRKIWVYLPPNYESTTQKFPVIYMHDGQNLFSRKAAYSSEWEVDETLNDLYAKTKQGFIVVGIENAGEERINEYTPWKKNNTYDIPDIPDGGSGKSYLDFIVNTIKPYIDSKYRTKKNQKNTALIGSSMGGLISYYGGLQYPDVFGRIGVLSPSFWFSEEVINFTKEKGKTKKVKMFLLVGGAEWEVMETDTRDMFSLLRRTGFKQRYLKLKVSPNGKHEEDFWKGEFLNVIKWLFPN